MAFDSGMLACVVCDINTRAKGARVDKINQPEKGEIVFSLRSDKENLKLCVCTSGQSPRICFENEPKENPKVAPSLCMALRKHLSGSRLISAELMGFERVIKLSFAARDELGYISEKRIYVEMMGRSSGFILTSCEDKIITASRFVDISAAAQRKILPGMSYELPPSQGKRDPLTEDEDSFEELLAKAKESSPDASCEAYIRNTYMGISPLISREIVYLSRGCVDARIEDVDSKKLWFHFTDFTLRVITEDFIPTLITAPDKGYVDFTFMPIKQYGSAFKTEEKDSPSELIEEFFASRNKKESAKHYAHDLFTVAKNLQAKLSKKLIALDGELADCKKKEDYKLYGDLITANMYRLKKGDVSFECENWYKEGSPLIKVPLDIRLTPAQNAQSYYKKYAKLKTGEEYKKEQIDKAKRELYYVESVIDSLERASTDDEYGYIREELTNQGYMKKSNITPGRKPKLNLPQKYVLASGRVVYCGKNNVQNDLLDSKIAGRNDYWFHVKNYPGSHVVMVCDRDGGEPSDADFTHAAMIAAYNSKIRGAENVAVDYTLVKNLKKPAGSPPGFVTYLTNYTAYVDAQMPDGVKTD